MKGYLKKMGQVKLAQMGQFYVAVYRQGVLLKKQVVRPPVTP